ncbi:MULTISPECIES: DUF6406 domain-containing protein [Actinomadura]|uniref:Uncharacterized protein n=1 Tax=Actinomadura miaoliensis TaxID=430685 RepID=A0ABP7W5D5_9ACTN
MAREEIWLGPHLQANTEVAGKPASFGVIGVDAREGHPLTVRLGAATDEEHVLDLRPGDTFPVYDQTWKIDRVEDAGSPDWSVVLVRVK